MSAHPIPLRSATLPADLIAPRLPLHREIIWMLPDATSESFAGPILLDRMLRDLTGGRGACDGNGAGARGTTRPRTPTRPGPGRHPGPRRRSGRLVAIADRLPPRPFRERFESARWDLSERQIGTPEDLLRYADQDGGSLASLLLHVLVPDSSPLPRSMTALTIALSSAEVLRPATKDRSILRWLTGKLRRNVRLE